MAITTRKRIIKFNDIKAIDNNIARSESFDIVIYSNQNVTDFQVRTSSDYFDILSLIKIRKMQG